MGTKTMIPSCKDFALSVSTGEYDNAPWPRRLMLKLHYAACYICRRYAAQIRFLGEAARKGRSRVDPAQAAQLKARLAKRLGGS